MRCGHEYSIAVVSTNSENIGIFPPDEIHISKKDA